jgi:hypothetical protein
VLLEPHLDHQWIEAEWVPPHHERDPPLGDEPSHMAIVHPETPGHLR